MSRKRELEKRSVLWVVCVNNSDDLCKILHDVLFTVAYFWGKNSNMVLNNHDDLVGARTILVADNLIRKLCAWFPTLHLLDLILGTIFSIVPTGNNMEPVKSVGAWFNFRSSLEFGIGPIVLHQRCDKDYAPLIRISNPSRIK